MFKRSIIFQILASLVCTAIAKGEIIQINNDSGSFELNSYAMNDLFTSTSPFLSSSDLSSVHSMLLNWGIDTDGKITILPLQTSAGLSLLTLVDEELGMGDTGADSSVGITSTGASSLKMFINDSEQDDWTLIESPFFSSQTLGATFIWGSIGSGDGFAWAGLEMGDAVSYTINDLGANALDEQAFQFISWDGTNGWNVIAESTFSASNSNVFTGTVIPAPPVALLLVTGTIGFRRRRS